jgi:hypothetical protein
MVLACAVCAVLGSVLHVARGSVQSEQLQHEANNDDKADDIDDGVHFFSLSGFRNNSLAMNLLLSVKYSPAYL